MSKPRFPRPWMPEDIARLRELAGTMSHAQIAVLMNRTRTAIRSRTKKEGFVDKDRFFTPGQIEIVKAMRGTHTCAQIAAAVGKSLNSIYALAQRLNLSEPMRWPQTVMKAMMKRAKDGDVAAAKFVLGFMTTGERQGGPDGQNVVIVNQPAPGTAIERMKDVTINAPAGLLEKYAEDGKNACVECNMYEREEGTQLCMTCKNCKTHRQQFPENGSGKAAKAAKRS